MTVFDEEAIDRAVQQAIWDPANQREDGLRAGAVATCGECCRRLSLVLVFDGTGPGEWQWRHMVDGNPVEDDGNHDILPNNAHNFTEPPPVSTWADGFGVWHVRVPNQPHRHEMTAYQALRGEIAARQGAAVPAFGLAVVTEDATTITYREDWSR